MTRNELRRKRDAAAELLEESAEEYLLARERGRASNVFQTSLQLSEAYCLWRELNQELDDLITDELHEEHVAEQLLSRIHSAGLEAAL